MPIPSDASYVGPGRRQVRLGSGEVVSRASAENAFAQSLGFRNNYEYKTMSARSSSLKRSARYKRDLKAAVARGMSPKEFHATAVRLANAPRSADGYPVDKSPNGPLAQYLNATGARSPGADYSVGDTPTVK